MELPYGKQWIDEDDIRAVVDVLHSDFITQGPGIKEFEKALADECGAGYAVAVNSGTAALHIACLAAGIGKGHELITSPNTFVASANCALYCGAKPVFADIDPDTYDVLPGEIGRKINERTLAVVPVHFAGQSCDMDAVREEVTAGEQRHGSKIFIIEDACQALGSSYKGKKTGSCAYSDMTVTSFHPVKHITTGEGGAVFTNDEQLYKKLLVFRNHGITKNPEELVYSEQAFHAPEHMNPWYYEQVELGYNYRITDIQSALGLSQLKKLPKFYGRRREIVEMYNDAFRGMEHVQTPFESDDCDSNFHLYVLLFDWEKIGISRAAFMTELKKQGIHTQVHYIPVHTQPYYRKTLGTGWGDCPNAENYYGRCLSIPLYPAMTDEDVSRCIMEIKRIAGS